jgi:DNA-binding transcriptional LysR family regulator
MKPVFTSEGVTSLREAARAGLGIAVLPEWLIREDILSGRLVRVLPQWNAKELPCHVVYQGQRMLPVRVRTFIDFAVAYMTTELRSKG